MRKSVKIFKKNCFALISILLILIIRPAAAELEPHQSEPTGLAAHALTVKMLNDIGDRSVRLNLISILFRTLTFSENVYGIYRGNKQLAVIPEFTSNCDPSFFILNFPYKTYPELLRVLQKSLEPAIQSDVPSLIGAATAIAITKTDGYNFQNMINLDAANKLLNSVHINEVATALYNLLFPYLACSPDGVFFSDYMSGDRFGWARYFFNYATTPEYITQLKVEQSIGAPDIRTKIMLVGYKLYQLFPQFGVQAKADYASNQLPGYSPPWTELIPPETFTGDMLVPEVVGAIARTESKQSVQFLPIPPVSYIKTCQTINGADVASFINGWAKDHGLVNSNQKLRNVTNWQPDLFFECNP